MQTDRRRYAKAWGSRSSPAQQCRGETWGENKRWEEPESENGRAWPWRGVGERSGGTGRWHPPELRLLGSKTWTQIHDRTDEECIRITRQTVGGDVMRGIIANAGTTWRARRIVNRDQRGAHMNREKMWGTEGAGHQRTESAESRSRGGNAGTMGECESMAGRTIN